MNIRTSAFRGLAILSLSVLGLAACDEKEDVITPPPVQNVSVSVVPSSVALNVGQTATLVAVVTGSTNQSVTWTSSNAAVATVSSAGVVEAKAPGVATIIATSAADANARGAAVVTVTSVPTTPVSISLAPATAAIGINGTVGLVATVTGSSNTAVTYRSSSDAVATVSATGVVTGKSAGTAVITAIAAADTTKKALSTITVVPGAAVGITVTPSTATIGVDNTQQFVATVTGSTNTGVTWRSASTAVATVDATGTATGVAAGTTVITAIANADTTVRATATLTVIGASVAIQTTSGTPAVGPFTVTTNVQVPAGTADTLVIRMVNNTTGTVYTIPCQTFTAAGATTPVTCVINPADYDALTPGAQVLPNGSYTLSAVLRKNGKTVDVAIATFSNPFVTNNTNTVNGVIAFDNSTSDTDNIADDHMAVNAGAVWHGGSATITLTPSIFAGNAISTIQIFIDQNCNGVRNANGVDGVAGTADDEAIRTVTITSGTGSVTFSETANVGAATPGIDDLSAAAVCFAVTNALDASGVVVPLTATSGTGAVITTGSPLSGVAGATQNQWNIDNVPTVLGALALPPSMTAVAPWPVLNWAGAATVFSATGTDAVAGVIGVDAGVNDVDVDFFAVSPTLAVATQANMAAAVAAAGSVEVTNAADLGSSSLSNSAYRLISRSVDALGNVIYGNVGTFGVDLDAPTAAVDATSMAASGSVNTASDVVVNITDVHSGSVQLRFRGTVYSVLEVDANADTDVRCVTDNAGTVGALPASGVCPWVSVGLVNIGGTTEQGTANHPAIPAPAATTEGYYVYEAQGIDRAGNVTTTQNFVTLTDVTVPGATIATAAFDYVNNTVQLTGTINENVDLASYDTRFDYSDGTGLGGAAGAGAGADVPDEVPFVVPTAVDSYGLPLTGVLSVSGANSVSVTDIRDATGTYRAIAFGFFATDVAANYAYTGQAVTPTAGGGVMYDPDGSGAAAPVLLPVANFNAEFDTNSTVADDAACVDRSGNGGAGCSDTNLYVEVTVDEEDPNPISTIYFYIVEAGADNTVGTADDYNVLVGTQAAANATVTTGITERIFRFSQAISPSLHRTIAAPNNVYRMFAVGVAANGSAIMSDVVNLTIQP